jgi:hypothetical protein
VLARPLSAATLSAPIARVLEDRAFCYTLYFPVTTLDVYLDHHH